jgi:hypothetical protein
VRIVNISRLWRLHYEVRRELYCQDSLEELIISLLNLPYWESIASNVNISLPPKEQPMKRNNGRQNPRDRDHVDDSNVGDIQSKSKPS